MTGNKAGKSINTNISDKAAEIIKDFRIKENEAQEIINTNIGTFDKDFEKAISVVQDFNELDAETKNSLISLLNDGKTATQENNEEKKKTCQSMFNGFILGAKTAAKDVLPALAQIASVATFFGLKPQ